MKRIGEMTIGEVLPHLQEIANTYGLRLNRLKEWKLARAILASRYGN